MSEAFLSQLSQEDMEYDGFFDGQNKTIPEGYETTVLVTGGFNGMEEGKAVQTCYINVIISAPGEFYNQKYRYNAKIYDMDISKRDLAKKNLSVIDAQCGFPMNGHHLTTENIEDFWSGKAHLRAKFGLMIGEQDGREINFIRGFGLVREKMLPPVGDRDAERRAIAAEQDAPGAGYQGTPVDSDGDIGF